jgi:hypothetical protein
MSQFSGLWRQGPSTPVLGKCCWQKKAHKRLSHPAGSLMTGSNCQAAHENGAALDSEVGLFLCLLWVREWGRGHCENVLRWLGRKVLSWTRGPLGTGSCFFEAFSWNGRAVFVLSFTRGHNGDQNGDPAGPKMEALLPAYLYIWGKNNGLSSVSTSCWVAAAILVCIGVWFSTNIWLMVWLVKTLILL